MHVRWWRSPLLLGLELAARCFQLYMEKLETRTGLVRGGVELPQGNMPFLCVDSLSFWGINVTAGGVDVVQ